MAELAWTSSGSGSTSDGHDLIPIDFVFTLADSKSIRRQQNRGGS